MLDETETAVELVTLYYLIRLTYYLSNK